MTLRILTLALAALALSAGTASAAAGPGSQTYTGGQQCTANFVFSDGTSTYIGQAAHCSGTDGNTATNGCEAGSMPIGTPVEVLGRDGETINGTLAYNSWITMQQAGETDANACQYNDFALIKVPNGSVTPTVPFFGGPTGLATTTRNLDDVFSYGNSSLRGGIELLSPKRGKSLGTSGGGWTHTVYTLTPGIPGDSGSGFLDAQGRAFGVLSTVAIAPLPASNGVSDLNKALAYMKAKTDQFDGVTLRTGGAFTRRIA